MQTGTVMLVVFCCLSSLLAAGAVDGGRPAVSPTNRVVTTSATGRFVVAGGDAVANMRYTRWAEETTGSLERFLGIRIPFRRQEAIEIRLVSGSEAAAEPSLVSRSDPGLPQRVITVNATRLSDTEMMDTLLCRALITGYLRDRRQGVTAIPPDSIPEWLATGVAQNLRPELRVRNRSVLVKWQSEASVPLLTDVFRWQTLSEGWPRRRSLCGMVVNWLGTFGGEETSYSRILEQLAESGRVTPGWLARELTRCGSEAEMEKAWQEWVWQQANRIQVFGELSSALIDQIRDELPLTIPAGPAGEAVRWLAPGEAIERRSEPGVSYAALLKARQLRMLAIGKAEEVARLGEVYAQFYESLSGGSLKMTLRYKLGRAEAMLDRLSDLTRKREAWLDVVEQEVRQRSDAWGEKPSAREPVLEKGRLERYVDEVEAKFLQSQKETNQE